MMKTSATEREEPKRIANRYEVHGVLGRGGMACVYLATDSANGRKVALKELQLADQRDRMSITTLFEREFHTLSQLAHPRVIDVYDYGVSARGPYYTMELLDGGDLRDRSPMPWRQACAVFFDVCSSLALLHSRRLVHRDISPRNIRCTQDGKAKLIDFGAMATMGIGGAQVVGTPAFTAPETVHRLALDGRADLFSLGATLYSTLTGHMPYPARSFAEALAAWNVKPLAPSARVPEIPAALDALVLSLISIEPSLRPKTAFDVMQRLAAIASLPRDESIDVAAAYLSTPTLVGRDDALDRVRVHLFGAMTGQGGGTLIRGAPGLGRSRVLDACALEAKTLGATVLRATATGERAPFSLARGLVEHLLAAAPGENLIDGFADLFDLPKEPEGRPVLRANDQISVEPEKFQHALSRFMLLASRAQPLVIAVDDVQRSDAASAAVLAEVIDKTSRGNVAVVLTADSSDRDTRVLEVLSKRCEIVELTPLTRSNTQAILSSIFGEAAHLELLTEETHKIAQGNPRLCMDIAQHLVDRDLVRYVGGTWILPDRLSASDLPRSAEDAMRGKLKQLSAAARCIAEAQALAYNELMTLEEYRDLRPGADPVETDHAVLELLTLGVISPAGDAYSLASRGWGATLCAGLDHETQQARHRALAEMYRSRAPLARIHHLFASGAEAEGLEALHARHREYAKGFDPQIIHDPNLPKLAATYEVALRAAIAHRSSPREIADQRRWACGLSVAAEGQGYWECAPPWFEQLAHDSGLTLWREDRTTTDPMTRLMNALTAAQNRYLATPEAARVYSVEEAIRCLAEYVVYSIAIGADQFDGKLLASLPPVLEPFAPLAPMLDAIWQNATATAENQCLGQIEASHARWRGVLEKLDALSGQEIEHLDAIRGAVVFALGMSEAQLGMASATSYCARLDHDVMQRLSALQLRRITRLQQGDQSGADRLRREAEVLSLQVGNGRMFRSLEWIESWIHERSGDLTELKQAIEKLRGIVARTPTWLPQLRDAEAQFELTRGDFEAARRLFEENLERVGTPGDERFHSMPVWISSRTGLASALIGLGDYEGARRSAAEALEIGRARGVRSAAEELVRTLALAEAKLGQHRDAAARLDVLIGEQLAMGVSGIGLGLSHEARARIAIWAKDDAAFAQHSRAAAKEYGRGARSPLAHRYEQLVNEALRSGFRAAPEITDIEPSTMLDSGWTGMTDVPTEVLRAMTGAQRSTERAERALQLLCETRKAAGGHLFIATSQGLQLAASQGEDSAPASLAGLVEEFLRAEHEQADTMTEIATGPLTEDAPDASMVRCGTATYELMTLSSVIRGEPVVAGVAAIAPGKERVRYVKQAQLLATLASHLIESGDVTAMRFDA